MSDWASEPTFKSKTCGRWRRVGRLSLARLPEAVGTTGARFLNRRAVTDCYSAVAPSLSRERKPAKNAARRRVNRHGGRAKHTCLFRGGTQLQSFCFARALGEHSRALRGAVHVRRLKLSLEQRRLPVQRKKPTMISTKYPRSRAHVAPFFSTKYRRATQRCDDALSPHSAWIFSLAELFGSFGVLDQCWCFGTAVLRTCRHIQQPLPHLAHRANWVLKTDRRISDTF